jgi:hypothetical protein
LFPTDTRGFEPVRYGGVLLSVPLHASVTLHNLLNVPVQFENKMGLKKKKLSGKLIQGEVLPF